MKYLSLRQNNGGASWDKIIPSLENHSKTLIKMNIVGQNNVPISFITKFSNLRELVISIHRGNHVRDFITIQHVIFPQLQVLKFPHGYPRFEAMNKFLENSGKNLKEFEFCVDNVDEDRVRSAVTKFCPKLKLYPLPNMEKVIDQIS